MALVSDDERDGWGGVFRLVAALVLLLEALSILPAIFIVFAFGTLDWDGSSISEGQFYACVVGTSLPLVVMWLVAMNAAGCGYAWRVGARLWWRVVSAICVFSVLLIHCLVAAVSVWALAVGQGGSTVVFAAVSLLIAWTSGAALVRPAAEHRFERPSSHNSHV